ncbi:DMT family transporter [Rhodococcus phenolicus]|uniref:DMT family transporter n=1 Tax=Rhodococcus phenolicus TaxID=263849 RepID=UPI0008370224|nr:DMT family transporter [Rhodococcus phenolicus]
MTGTATASAACALAAAVLFAAASVAQQRSAAAVPGDRSLLGGLVRSPRWWAGIIGDGGGYLLQVAALALGAILIVQPLLVTSLLFALPMSAIVSGRRIGRATWLLAGALCVSLAAFLVVGNPTEGQLDAAARHWALPLGAVLLVAAAAATAAAFPVGPHTRALLLGSAGGILFGVAVVFTKHVTDLFEHGLGTVAASWQTWALIAAGLTGGYLQQLAFQAGALGASLPALTIGEPLAAVFLGMTVLGERLRVDGPALALVVASVVVMLATTVALSRDQAHLTTDDAAATHDATDPDIAQ